MEFASVYRDVLETVSVIPVFDSHEHIGNESARINDKPADIFTLLSQYINDDLKASGMPEADVEKIHNSSISLDSRWKLFEPHWEQIKHGSYAQTVLQSLNKLFSVPQLNTETYRAVSEKIDSNIKKGFYHDIIKNLCNIELCLSFHDYDVIEQIDRETFIPVPHCEMLAVFNRLEELKKIETFFDSPVSSLKKYLQLIENLLNRFKTLKMPAIKFAMAYGRTLKIERPSCHEAERAFNEILEHYGEGVSYREALPMQDYLLRYMIEIAGDLEMTVVFHTGIQAGNRYFADDSRASYLSGIFRDYPHVTFDLFHGGIPDFAQTGLLAKYFPNVYVDMAWMHTISPQISRQALRYWFDTVPENKIIGFGGDFTEVENIYGHLSIARENIAHILSERILSGYLNKKDAAVAAEKLLNKNPKAAFRLT